MDFTTQVMIGTLFLLSAVILAKIITVHLIVGINQQISQIEQVRQETLNRLKVLEAQKAVAGKNQKTLEAKRAGLLKRKKHLEEQLKVFEKEDRRIRERDNLRKVQLTHRSEKSLALQE